MAEYDFTNILIGQNRYNIHDAYARNELGALQTPIRTGKNIAFFGDSWTRGTGADPVSKRFSTLVADNLGMNELNMSVGASGFCIPNNTILAQIQGANNTLTSAQKENTTIVIIYAGINDIRHWDEYELDFGTYRLAVRECANTASSVFPNAVVYMCLSNTRLKIYEPREFNANTWAIMRFLFTEHQSNIVCLQNISNVISGDPDFYTNDTFHPSTLGHSVIAGYLCNVLKGGCQDIDYYATGVDLDDGYSFATGGVMYLFRHNFNIDVTPADIVFPDTITELTKIGTLQNTNFAPAVASWVSVSHGNNIVGQVGITKNGNVYFAPLDSSGASGCLTQPFTYRFGSYS